jgi:phosphopantetheinyl transferase
MPLFYQQYINQTTRLAIWKIEETEEYFSATVPINKNITHPHKRLQHYAGRYLLRFLFPDFPYEEILIADTNKPYLDNEAYHFSISHCGDYAAAIVSKNLHVGIDIEIPLEKILKIKHKFINSDNDYFLNQLNHSDQIFFSTLIWSAKETLFKWYGKGNVDFKEMLNIHLHQKNNFSSLKAEIQYQNFYKEFEVFFEDFKQLILTYTYT